mmetsp:Transcript_22574/g.38583  ORF Transcript_22574/g.38583 Transcript_22574/m.38583 type:complete len:358 (+) Transcript_22574:154-1227(+)
MSLFETLQRENTNVLGGDIWNGINFLEELDLDFAKIHQPTYHFSDVNDFNNFSTIQNPYQQPFTTQPQPSPMETFPIKRSISSRRKVLKEEFEEDEEEEWINSSSDEASSCCESPDFSKPNSPDTSISTSSSAGNCPYRLNFHDAGKSFCKRMVCFFPKEGEYSVYCEICDGETSVEIAQGKNAVMKCKHYVVCNECRCRVVRRLLRCVDCCKELTGIFPVCKEGRCVDTKKEYTNSAGCPRCSKKLRKEVCGSDCTRRKLREYNQLRSRLNGIAVVLVQSAKDCLANSKDPGSVRPCAHYSFCEKHQVIYKGHGNNTVCNQCKKSQRKTSRKSYDDLYDDDEEEPLPRKKHCSKHI